MTEPSRPLAADLAILAHNEAARLPELLRDLARQDVLGEGDVDLRLHVMSNGSRDGTAEVARTEVARHPALVARVEVHDLAEAGKSRTMNRFLRERLRPGAEVALFMDGDIRLPEPGTLSTMIGTMRARPGLTAFVSRPVKDVVHDRAAAGPVARMIAAGGGTLDDWQKTISGQLFALRGDFARALHLPQGLPVEDGFIRAMVVTDFLSRPEDLSVIDGDPEVFHLYGSIRSLSALLRHQARLVTGGAINAALFGVIRRDCDTAEEAQALLARAAASPDWLAETLSRELPRAPHGWVPFAFLTHRLKGHAAARLKRPKSAMVMLAGLALDSLAWVMASARLAMRQGAGHW